MLTQSTGVIYVDNNGELRANKYQSKEQFNEFLATIPEDSIVLLNGVEHLDRVPESQKEVYPIFVKSCRRQWGNSFQVHQEEPEQETLVKSEVQIDYSLDLAPVPEDKPKKTRKPRTKKESK